MDSHRFILLFKMKFIKANVIFLTFINLILDKLKTIALVCQRFQLETVFGVCNLQPTYQNKSNAVDSYTFFSSKLCAMCGTNSDIKIRM